MSDFNVRSDSVNVEQIMEQIRARIREKRGVDYTEEQIRELASVKLERFLDPSGVRSDLLEQFRRSQPPPAPLTVPLYPFEDTTLFESHRGIVRFFRRLFRPVLKLFFNANALASSMHAQTVINRQTVDRLDAIEASLRRNGDLYYELLHNMVVELTRMTIEVKNAKMRVESIASRLEFNERRARALESVVVYKPAQEERDRQAAQPARSGGGHAARDQGPAPVPPRPATPPEAASPGVDAVPGVPPGEGPGQRSRRRRRRRGRRGGASAASIMGAGAVEGAQGPEAGFPSDSTDAPVDAPTATAGAGAPEMDARAAKTEPIERPFGSSTHPAEGSHDTSAAPAAQPHDLPASESPDDDQ
jgi:hypothetical protein